MLTFCPRRPVVRTHLEKTRLGLCCGFAFPLLENCKWTNDSESSVTDHFFRVDIQRATSVPSLRFCGSSFPFDYSCQSLHRLSQTHILT